MQADNMKTDKHSALQSTLSNRSNDRVGETIEIQNLNGLDDAILRAQGHEAVLPRSFSWWGAIGLGYRYSDMQARYTPS